MARNVAEAREENIALFHRSVLVHIQVCECARVYTMVRAYLDI